MPLQFVQNAGRTRSAASRVFLGGALAVLAGVPGIVGAANFYAGTSPTNIPWPGGVVPYEFTNTLTAAEQQTYLDGLREWELAGNVKFVPHTNQTHWILFAYNTNGFDNVSSTTNPQVVSVSSLSRAQVCHEMGHSFGFTHENIRPDATNYITVLTNNITDEPDNLHWFVPDSSTVPYGDYDFESVMHLGWDFDSIVPNALATQEPKPPYFLRYQFRMGNYCLSPGDRAALAYLYGPPAVPLTNIVTTTADFGPGSLRGAIYYATDHPGTTIRFEIPMSDSGYSNGVFNIQLTGMLPPLVADGTVIDGSTEPDFAGKPLIVVDASQILPETFTSDTFRIYSADNQIKNIAFTGFDWNAITLEYADATNNTISGCWIGVDSTGTHAAPSAYQGILVADGASRNIIGGTNVLERDVISGNSEYGIFITGTNTIGNVVLGNYIGADASGSNAVSNGNSGVFIGGGAHDNLIGGTNPAAGNVISGNADYGIYLTNTTGNVILGNYIGVNAGGETALGNELSGIGIVNDAQNNFIGGAGADARNVISGNQQYGIVISEPGASNNFVFGNYIGLGAGGTNSPGIQINGVGLLNEANANTIGGAAVGAGNVLSGNLQYGLLVDGASGNVIQGNYIGPDASGKAALPNDNTYGGIGVWGGSSNNLFGGTSPGAGNSISGNDSYGIFFADPGTSGNSLEGNFIGADSTGTNALGNWFSGVALWNGASGNAIGGINAGQGNTIAFNGYAGVNVYDTPTINNSIRGNSIFGNSALGIDLVATNDVYPGFTANDVGDADTGPNDLQNFPVLTNVFGFVGNTIVLGKLNSLAGETFAIDVYRSAAADSSGYGEGQFYVGTVSATTDGSGDASFAYTNRAGNFAGQYFSATATSPGGDTSEFSADGFVTNASVTQPTQFNPPTINGDDLNLSFPTVANQSYTVQRNDNLTTTNWVDFTNFTSDGTLFQFVVPAANAPQRFFRVREP
jgi:parallel beta-helix repeat protein